VLGETLLVKGAPCASARQDAGSPDARCLAFGVVELEKVADLGQPAILHEADVCRVVVVALVCGSICELHRDPEAVVVLRADLGQELERLDSGNAREQLGRFEEVSLFLGPRGMNEPECNGMPNALRIDLRRLRSVLARRDRVQLGRL
jgi:hypothetical protein